MSDGTEEVHDNGDAPHAAEGDDRVAGEFEQMFEDIDTHNPAYPYPQDGYRVDLQEHNDYGEKSPAIRLMLYFVAGGECQWAVCIDEKWAGLDDPFLDPEGEKTSLWEVRAVMDRMYWLWVALCGYLNAGGGLGDFIFKFVQRPLQVCTGVSDCRETTCETQQLNPLIPPEGFQLFRTAPDEMGGHYEHIFIHENGDKAVVWHEDIAIEETTLENLDELEDLANEAEEVDCEEPEAPRLLHPPDLEAEEEDREQS